MAKNLTKEQWLARAEAYAEAAEHLGMSWTENSTERDQGDVVACRLRDISIKCFERADQIPAKPQGRVSLLEAINSPLPRS